MYIVLEVLVFLHNCPTVFSQAEIFSPASESPGRQEQGIYALLL